MYVEVNYEKQAVPRKRWKPVIGRELVSFRLPQCMKLTRVRTTHFRGSDYTFFTIKEGEVDLTCILFEPLKEVFKVAGIELEHTFQYGAFMLRGIYHIETSVLNTVCVHCVEGFESEDIKATPYVAKLSLPEIYY